VLIFLSLLCRLLDLLTCNDFRSKRPVLAPEGETRRFLSHVCGTEDRSWNKFPFQQESLDDSGAISRWCFRPHDHICQHPNSNYLLGFDITLRARRCTIPVSFVAIRLTYNRLCNDLFHGLPLRLARVCNMVRYLKQKKEPMWSIACSKCKIIISFIRIVLGSYYENTVNRFEAYDHVCCNLGTAHVLYPRYQFSATACFGAPADA